MAKLTTEQRNPNTMQIDQLKGTEIAKLINQADHSVATAISTQNDAIGQAIEAITARFQTGGRIIYMGAGTSGRLGALDAIELTPTYGVAPERAFGLLAGGQKAMFAAVEGAEDSKKLAVQDLERVKLNQNDTVIALAASGRTPYTISALTYGNKIGALTVSITCTASNQMTDLAQIAINPVVGPEVVTGSTRMKAGSAQKMVLNMLSTGVMIRMGYVYENLMINVQPTNEKLVHRASGILATILSLDDAAAGQLLAAAHNNVAAAIVMAKANQDYTAALKLLAANDNRVGNII
ncbi:N-acetylmuramic acid 6-phosphate etherase [Loigolactobacillus jiayinensis]|uniref:N-acetylmuramic acid 6-phosphate etherase n=1 Tax=Loigolactobacillus jiayinensis TaxID=2486016 RepID=A0ABW1RCP5_9LACO|nr:N-acetylmuramic acid 6-phosphate etherase [Loigolactobacillus jiayinensis]